MDSKVMIGELTRVVDTCTEKKLVLQAVAFRDKIEKMPNHKCEGRVIELLNRAQESIV